MNRLMTRNHKLIAITMALIAIAVGPLVPASGFAQSLSNLNLSSSSGANTNDDDLNVSYTLAGGATTAGTAWYRNGLPAMTLFFPFEGGAGNALQDISGYRATTAVISGSPSWMATGGHDGGGCYMFNGNDYMLAGNNTFPVHSSYTQSAWIYRTGYTGLGYSFIIAGQGALAATHGFRVTSDNRVGAGQNNNFRVVQSSADAIQFNTWYFVAVTYDNPTGTMIMYYNGQPVDTAIVPLAQRDVTDSTVEIGATPGAPASGDKFLGRIDDVRIYNYALSRQQIAAMYTNSNRLTASESSVGETWQARVTPYSATAIGAMTASNTITIVPTAPVITSTAVSTGIALKRYLYYATATGGPTPTYSLTTSPSGMTIDATSGLIRWVPSTSGSYGVTVTATNSQGSNSQSYNINVANPSVGLANVALTASGTNDLTASYNLTLGATMSATAWYKNGNPTMIFYLPMEGGSTWALDDVSGNNITCTPIGSSAPNFNPTGGHDGRGCYEFNGTNFLIAGNIFPTQASYTKSAWVYRTASGFTHILSGWEHNTGAMTPAGHGFRVTLNGSLSAGHNGNWKVVQTPDGTIANNTWYFVAVTFDYASSTMQLYLNGNRVDSQAVAAAYRNVNDPGLLVGATQGAFAWPGRIDDARVYNYALTRQQIANLFTATGGDKMVGAEVHNGEIWQARVTPFSATEAGTPYSTGSITIGAGNLPPAIATIGNKSVNEGQNLNFSVTATDPNGTIPALSATNVPANATFTDNGNGSGTFNFNPNYIQSGSYSVKFYASDGVLADSQTIAITVVDVNRTPVLASIGPKSVYESQTLAFNVSATDPDGATPALSATPLPANAVFTDNGNGTGSFTFNPNYAQAGTFNVTFSASDGNTAATEIVVITVSNVNRLPVLTVVGPQTGVEGSPLTFNVTATDPDNELLTLTAQYLPTNATFVDHANDTGTFVFTPAAGQAGTYSVLFKVTDPSTAVDTHSVVITILSTAPPTNWAATIHVEGEVAGNAAHSSEVIVGMADNDLTTPSSPKPPEYTAFVQLWKSGGDGPYYRDLRKSGGLCYYWILDVDPHGTVAPPATPRCATIGWNPAQFSTARHYVLRQGSDPSGTVVVADMRSTTSYQVCDIQTDRYFTVEWFDDACATSSFFNIPLAAGWNLISLPVTPTSSQVSQLIPTAQAVFEFNSLYQEATALTPGKGYWVKVPAAVTLSVSGTPVTNVSGPLVAGWNLKGAPGCTVTPTSTPSGNIEAIFGFNSVYQPAAQLIPGAGYWIKSSAASTLNAVCASPAPAYTSMPVATSESGTGVVTIHATGQEIGGVSQAEIVLGMASQDQTIPEPPSMPLYSVALTIYGSAWQGPFYKDVRQNTQAVNSWVIAVNPHGNAPTQGSAAATLSWNPSQLGDSRYELREGSDGTGSVLVADMRSQNSIVVTGGNALVYYTITRAAGKSSSLPGGFALDQNYPNPFNPSTQIGYSLPQAGHVRLDIYNVLGQQVRSLVDQSVEAGHHIVTWDATDNAGRSVSSGIYFYRITSDGFVDHKKMLLLR